MLSRVAIATSTRDPTHHRTERVHGYMYMFVLTWLWLLLYFGIDFEYFFYFMGIEPVIPASIGILTKQCWFMWSFNRYDSSCVVLLSKFYVSGRKRHFFCRRYRHDSLRWKERGRAMICSLGSFEITSRGVTARTHRYCLSFPRSLLATRIHGSRNSFPFRVLFGPFIMSYWIEDLINEYCVHSCMWYTQPVLNSFAGHSTHSYTSLLHRPSILPSVCSS